MTTLRPAVLILGSRFDLTCDLMATSLKSRHVAFFRLNSEDLPLFHITLNINPPHLELYSTSVIVEIAEHQLKGVYYRLPTFLRASGLEHLSPEDKLFRSHWATFVRSLMIFRRTAWINHPVATYEAEHKPLQLAAASVCGFSVPRTIVTNSTRNISRVDTSPDSSMVALKGVDTVYLRGQASIRFGYTSLLSADEISKHATLSAPFILQQAVHNKLDLRVTVVDNDTWCAQVTVHGKPIFGDWRLAKLEAEFTRFDLPAEIQHACTAITKRMGLRFSGIDLALSDGVYYFIELNPTGEWAWLQETVGFPIASSLIHLLNRAASEPMEEHHG